MRDAGNRFSRARASFPQSVGALLREQALGLGVGLLHSGAAAASKALAFRGERQAAAAPVLLVDGDLHQPAAFERLEVGGQRGAVHGEQDRDAADARRLGTVERRQQRELALGQPNGRSASSKRRASARAARCT